MYAQHDELPRLVRANSFAPGVLYTRSVAIPDALEPFFKWCILILSFIAKCLSVAR